MAGLTENELNLVISFLNKKINPLFILLFGSAVRENLRPDSDIDLAVMAETALDEWEKYLLAQQLAELIGREVDLIDLRTSTTVMAAQIVSTGKVIYCRNEAARQWYFMRTLKEFALLNERRQVILDAIAKRGRVYDRSGNC